MAQDADQFTLDDLRVERVARTRRLQLTALQVYPWATLGWRCEISSDLQQLLSGEWFVEGLGAAAAAAAEGSSSGLCVGHLGRFEGVRQHPARLSSDAPPPQQQEQQQQQQEQEQQQEQQQQQQQQQRSAKDLSASVRCAQAIAAAAQMAEEVRDS